MKRSLIFFLCSLLVPLAQADLLDRMRLEDTLKNRVEDAFRLYDPKAKVLIRFDYKTFSGTLPGTSIETRGEINTFNIDSGDILRVTVEIYSDLDEIGAEAKEYVLKTIPLDKGKVFVEYKKLSTQFPKEVPRPNLDPQALSTIAQEAVHSVTKVFGFLFGLTLVVYLAFMFHQNSKKLKEFKQQVQLLTAALSERAEPSRPLPAAATPASKDFHSAGSGKESEAIQKLALGSLQEIFADAYWCREDAYAHWMWKHLDSQQRTELLAQFPLMKEYSLYFVDIRPLELAYHEHPYYLHPQGLLWTSQEDLSLQVRSDFSLWHFISPLRQQSLPLSLEERLKAVQTKASVLKGFSSSAQSPRRVLSAKISWGELSSDDENTLFTHPEMVPVEMRENIRSLVWLAHKDEAFIQKVLARYDARSLAAAWVGPESVLKKLEALLPEKKLKLLVTYKEKTTPSRHSEAYESLVLEGLKNEAA